MSQNDTIRVLRQTERIDLSHQRARDQRLAQRLIAAGGWTAEEADATLREASARSVSLCDLLAEKQGAAAERKVWEAVARAVNLPLSTADELIPLIDPKVALGFPRRFLDHYRLIPVAESDVKVVIATYDPDTDLSEVATLLGTRHVDLRLVTPIDFRRLRMAIELIERRDPKKERAQEGGPRDLLAHDDRMAELQAVFEAILLDAISARASDVHLERYGDRVRVRLRVDGDLRDLHHFKVGPDQLTGLVNVIKVRANLDIAERRVPQGGRMTIRAGERVYDLRIQTQPALHAEHVVIRLLPHETHLLGIEELGFPAAPAKAYRRLLDSPSGLVLVVGPTGSGKSTTLYAGLQVLAGDATRKVLTIEDPIEYAIHGVQQSQVRPELHFSFAHAMRAFVREDPDVILVGEVRDGETALEALRASQTGHLVLSTLHSNDSVDAVQRLIDLGMHPHSIASEVLAVFAQRLAKRICRDCRAPAPPIEGDLVTEVFPDGVPADFNTWRGIGCTRCAGYGFHGRIAAVEFLPASPAFRAAISRRVSVDELRSVALDAGLFPMREHALSMVADGTIAFDELRALLPPERLAPEYRRHADRPRPAPGSQRYAKPPG